MSEEHEPGPTVPANITVNVNASAVHKAVRNVMKNEMRIDAEELRREALETAKATVTLQVDTYLKGHGYGQAQLDERVRAYVERYLKHDLERMVQNAVRLQVDALLKEQALEIIEGLVQKGLELKVGWNKTIKVKTTEA